MGGQHGWLGKQGHSGRQSRPRSRGPQHPGRAEDRQSLPRDLGELAEKVLKKGAKVYVEGALQTRKWTDQGGQERYSTEVVLQRFRGELTMLDGKGGGGPGGGGGGDMSEGFSEPASGGRSGGGG